MVRLEALSTKILFLFTGLLYYQYQLVVLETFMKYISIFLLILVVAGFNTVLAQTKIEKQKVQVNATAKESNMRFSGTMTKPLGCLD